MPTINGRSGSTNCQSEEIVQVDAERIVLQQRTLTVHIESCFKVIRKDDVPSRELERQL